MPLTVDKIGLLTLLAENKGMVSRGKLSAHQKKIATYLERDGLVRFLALVPPDRKRDDQKLRMTMAGIVALKAAD